MEALFFTRDYESVQTVQAPNISAHLISITKRCRKVKRPICFVLNANHQMAVGTYESTNRETLAFASHEKGKMETQNWKSKEKAIEVLIVSVLVSQTGNLYVHMWKLPHSNSDVILIV
jgi:hypothetical protein